MNRYVTYLSWFALALAILSWGAVGYAGQWLQGTAKERGASAVSADQKASEAAYAARLKALVQETKLEREDLERISEADIVNIANAIESAGKSVGVDARVSTAIPGGNPKEIPGGDPMHVLTFIVQAEGSFAGVVQLVHVLESFTAFSTIEQFEFERVQTSSASTPPWRTSIRLRIYTTSDIAS